MGGGGITKCCAQTPEASKPLHTNFKGDQILHKLQGHDILHGKSHGPGNFAHKPEPGDFAHRRHGPKILRTNSKDHEIVCTNFKSHEILRTTSMGSEFCPQTPRPLNILQGPLNIPCATSFCANTARPILCANSKRQVCVQFPRAPNCTHKLQAPSNFAHKLESPKSLH